MGKGRKIHLILIIIIFILGYILYSQINDGAEFQILKLEERKEWLANDRRPYMNSINENVYINTHLYDQLSETAKIIYANIYENSENLKSGTYKIEFENAFKNILEEENGSEKLSKEYQSAIEAITYENPELFYYDVTKMYINIEKITRLVGNKYNVYISDNSETGEGYLADGFYGKEDIDKCQNEIEEIRDKILKNIEGKNEIEKIKYIHDYLIDTIEYDTTLQQSNIYNIYGALVLKRSVCEGYAKALQYLLSSAGIENVIVSGTATNTNGITENHAWNYVKIDEEWYAIDATWDDPVIIGGGKLPNKLKYQYFLKGSNTMDKNHFASKRFTQKGKEFEYPTLSETDYDI